MIELNPSSFLEIPEIEKVINPIVISQIWIEYGVNGILPRLQIDFEGVLTDIDLGSKGFQFRFKLIYHGIKVSDCRCCIESKSRVDNKLRLVAFMIPELEFIRGRKNYTYNSVKELVSSLWKWNNNLELPEHKNDIFLCQANDKNHTYLSKTLQSIVADRSFYYGLFNNLEFVELSNRKITYDLTDPKATKFDITIKNRNAESEKPETSFSDVRSGKLVEKYYIIMNNHIYYCDQDTYQLEENRLKSIKKLNDFEDEFIVEYYDPLIEIGDVIKVKITETTTLKFMILSTQLNIVDDKIMINSRCVKYDN